MSQGGPLIEVIACSVIDALEAEEGGAGRLEVVSDLARGGLTPPLELVQQIVARVSIPVRVMLRGNDGYGLASQNEKERLCVAAREFSQLGIDGLVLGFLRSARIDLEIMQQLLNCAPGLKATFHHAFEETEPFGAIQELKKSSQVDRILTHGGHGTWATRIERLARYREQASPEIEILAGGGLDAEKIATINRATGVHEFHVGRAARAGLSVEGKVQAARVRALVEAAS